MSSIRLIALGASIAAVSAGASVANAQEAHFRLSGETGAFAANLDFDGEVTGLNAPAYFMHDDDDVTGAVMNLGAAYDFEFPSPGWRLGVEGVVGVLLNSEPQLSSTAGSSFTQTHLGCTGFQGVILPNGACSVTPSVLTTTTEDFQTVDVDVQNDYTLALLFGVSHEWDRWRIGAAVGPAAAQIRADAFVSSLSTTVVNFTPANIGVRQNVLIPEESFSDSGLSSGWAAKLSADMDVTDTLSVGFVYQYSDFGEVDFDGTARFSGPSVELEAQSIQMRIALRVG